MLSVLFLNSVFIPSTPGCVFHATSLIVKRCLKSVNYVTNDLTTSSLSASALRKHASQWRSAAFAKDLDGEGRGENFFPLSVLASHIAGLIQANQGVGGFVPPETSLGQNGCDARVTPSRLADSHGREPCLLWAHEWTEGAKKALASVMCGYVPAQRSAHKVHRAHYGRAASQPAAWSSNLPSQGFVCRSAARAAAGLKRNRSVPLPAGRRSNPHPSAEKPPYPQPHAAW